MIKALLSKKNSKTGKEIATRLGIELNPSSNYVDFLIRWGNTTPKETGKVLNKAKAILTSSNKPEALKILREKGLSVLPECDYIFPCVGRTKYHTGGSGFFSCRNERDVRIARRKGAVYFTRFYPKTREFRVHVGSGKVLLFSEKEGNKHKIIWNKAKNGFTFRHLARHMWIEDSLLMEIQRASKQAVEALGLDFGAVDILAYPRYGNFPQFVILEVNTCPSLSPLALEKYLEYFRNIIGY